MFSLEVLQKTDQTSIPTTIRRSALLSQNRRLLTSHDTSLKLLKLFAFHKENKEVQLHIQQGTNVHTDWFVFEFMSPKVFCLG